MKSLILPSAWQKFSGNIAYSLWSEGHQKKRIKSPKTHNQGLHQLFLNGSSAHARLAVYFFLHSAKSCFQGVGEGSWRRTAYLLKMPFIGPRLRKEYWWKEQKANHSLPPTQWGDLFLALLLPPCRMLVSSWGTLRPEPMDLLRDSSFLHVFVLFLKSFSNHPQIWCQKI